MGTFGNTSGKNEESPKGANERDTRDPNGQGSRARPLFPSAVTGPRWQWSRRVE
jgi:hypothetical protein